LSIADFQFTIFDLNRQLSVGNRKSNRDFQNKSYWERIDILSGDIYDVFEPIEATAFIPDEWQSQQSILADFAQNGEIVYG